MNDQYDYTLKMMFMALFVLPLIYFFSLLSFLELFLIGIVLLSLLPVAGYYLWLYYIPSGINYNKRLATVKKLPSSLYHESKESVFVGSELDLKIPLFLPDSIRSRHVHILGATGSGKTESVILNFLKQDIERGYGAIILDAKGDASFLKYLKSWVESSKLKVFDLGSAQSATYNPLEIGSSLEASQRLFSSLTWSEEYYKSKAFSALQKLFERHSIAFNKNPNLIELGQYLDNQESYAAATTSNDYPKKIAEKEFYELSGLRDQIKSLSVSYLKDILSSDQNKIELSDAYKGSIIYFRLQSLLSPQIVSILGKLVINHLNYIAGSQHRLEGAGEVKKLLPVYLDEFASFVCPEFTDLISKARSANMALHFSHQSIGDLVEVSRGFLNCITDNSATKIVLRINDPDSAEYFSRSFGTKLYQKITQRITHAKKVDNAEISGEGTQREAHQFRAPPDLFKTLPTGFGSILVAHGENTEDGGSHVFKVKFERPELGLDEGSSVKV